MAGALAPACTKEARVPKYTVTGGPGGDAGVEIGGTRYEPGEVVDAPSKEVDWLVEAGYLSTASKTPAKTKGTG